MTIVDALDKLKHAGYVYVIDEDSNGIYLGRLKGRESVPLRDPSLSEALDSLVSNKQAVINYYSGMYP